MTSEGTSPSRNFEQDINALPIVDGDDALAKQDALAIVHLATDLNPGLARTIRAQGRATYDELEDDLREYQSLDSNGSVIYTLPEHVLRAAVSRSTVATAALMMHVVGSRLAKNQELEKNLELRPYDNDGGDASLSPTD